MPIAIAFYVLAAIVGFAVPIVAGALFWHQFSATWSTELPKYQALFGGLAALFAVSLASFGVALTIGNQRQIASRQLAAQRQEQNLARNLAKRQIASAFMGELEVILNELGHESLKPPLERALNKLTELNVQSPASVQVETVRIGHLGRYYESSPGNVGLFAPDVARGLTRFYATLEDIRADVDWYSTAIEILTTEKNHIMTYQQITTLINKVLQEIDFCLKLGPTLLSELGVEATTAVSGQFDPAI